MTTYVHLTPTGATYHILSPRMKTIGPVSRQTTFCGLYVLPHSALLSRTPEKVCKVCRKRLEAHT